MEEIFHDPKIKKKFQKKFYQNYTFKYSFSKSLNISRIYGLTSSSQRTLFQTTSVKKLIIILPVSHVLIEKLLNRETFSILVLKIISFELLLK